MNSGKVVCIITFIIYIIALVKFLAGFSGNDWIHDGDTHMGLWNFCSKNGGCTEINLIDDMDAWFVTTASFMVIALLAVFGAGVSFLWLPVTAAFHWVASLLTLLSIIIFGAEYQDLDDDSRDLHWNLGWCYDVTVAAGVLLFLNAILTTWQAKKTGWEVRRRTVPCVDPDDYTTV